METLQKLIMLLTEKIKKRFYGKVEISFEAGNIVTLKVTESIKL